MRKKIGMGPISPYLYRFASIKLKKIIAQFLKSHIRCLVETCNSPEYQYRKTVNVLNNESIAFCSLFFKVKVAWVVVAKLWGQDKMQKACGQFVPRRPQGVGIVSNTMSICSQLPSAAVMGLHWVLLPGRRALTCWEMQLPVLHHSPTNVGES